jgi:tetratricopeptide (TPR) repeat protein
MIEMDPIQGYTWRASHYETSRELDKAIADATKLVELQPGATAPLELRSRLYTANDNNTAAMVDLNTAIALDPNSEANYWARISLHQIEDTPEAKPAILADYEKIIEVAPDEAARVYESRAKYLLAQKDYAGAIVDYSKAIDRDGTSQSNYRARASSYMKLGDYASAVADFTKMIELKPDTIEFYAVRADANLRAGHILDAAADYGVAVWRFLKHAYWPTATSEELRSRAVQ